MIRKLVVKNWQRHKHLELDLGRVTTIVGSTNAGKSALLRALAWVALNFVKQFTPKSKKMLRHGTKRTTVTLEVDGHTISRVKGDRNAYYLDGTKLAAFGTKVPDEVTKVLNLGELNFQKQIGMPFWFSESPGQVSKHLNQIVDLSVIDDTLKNLGKMLGKTKSQNDVVQERYTKAKAERKNLKWVVEANNELRELEELEEQVQNHADRARILHELVEGGTKARKHVDRVATVLLHGEAVVLLGKRWEKTWNESIELRIKIILARARKKEIEAAVPDTSGLDKIEKKLNAQTERLEGLQALCYLGFNYNEDVMSERKQLKKLEAELKEYKVCPACNQTIPS